MTLQDTIEIDPTLSSSKLKNLFGDYAKKVWDLRCEDAKEEEVKPYEDAMNLCLYIAAVKDAGFTVSR